MTRITLRKVIIISFCGILLVITAYNLWAYQGTLLIPFTRSALSDTPHQPLTQVLSEKSISGPIPDLRIEIIKSKHVLTIYSGQLPLKTYTVALGQDIGSAKGIAGDNKTPEGQYVIVEKTQYAPPRRFLGDKLLLLNYPNSNDAYSGFRRGILTGSDFLAVMKACSELSKPPQSTPLGGDISIHGGNGPFMGSSWTNGSAALYPKDIDELFDTVPVGTKVIIRR